ncbi:hypothetical protein OSB04_007596 [Centaurea solstitialis]|uniref:Uncharacterized protein n=1 Tax=Centaurea solstitialis TaxID=347529 RepID=A0AA38TVP0_9ASTR|nr:hypothetical protein OSB04_007596 [Centaurea solstitialis]
MDQSFQPYDKECMKMAILKHEQTFKEQVYELHRLYQIQKMLMKNMQNQENTCFNYQQQKTNNKLDLEQQPEATKEYKDDHIVKETTLNDEEIEEDECEIELTLGPTSFNRRRRMTNKPESSDSVASFSSSSTDSNHIKRIERITRENSSFLSGNRRNNNSSSSDRSSLKQQPPWMYQVLSLNMT